MVIYLNRPPADQKKWLNQFILRSCDGFADGVPAMMSVPIVGAASKTRSAGMEPQQATKESIGWATEPPRPNKYGQYSFGMFYAALIDDALKKAIAKHAAPSNINPMEEAKVSVALARAHAAPPSKPTCDYTIFRDQVMINMAANNIKPEHPEDLSLASVAPLAPGPLGWWAKLKQKA